MNDREEQVTEAHKQTFEWIFDDGVHDFASWLQSEGQKLYWVNGLAGSGKSTLMRFLNEHRKTKQLVQSWGGKQRVAMASFFFWESGTVTQRSQAGLLRSILFQLLKRQPKLITSVFSELWSELWVATTHKRIEILGSWSLGQLLTPFLRFFELYKAHRTFILLDGLDEFEGDHRTTLDLLDRLCKTADVKICVSSRPWDVFEKAFVGVPTLRLQDLTFDDMSRYVYGKLGSNPQLRRMVEDKSEECGELVTDMVKRADGVFLWVSLAVRTLLEAPEEDLTAMTLRYRLHDLPRSLDRLYQHLLLDEQPHADETARIFRLMRAREVVCDFTRDQDASSLTVWEVALAYDSDEQNAMVTTIQHVDLAEVDVLCCSTTDLILRRCCGLVQVHRRRSDRDQFRDSTVELSMPYAKISYLHRTVKDFLTLPPVWQQILSLTLRYRPHLRHLRSIILQFKLCFEKPRRPSRRVAEWFAHVSLAMTHARYASPEVHSEVFALLNEMDRTLTWFYPIRETAAHDSWARSTFGTLEQRGRLLYPQPFLGLTLRFGVASYLEDYLDSYDYNDADGDGVSLFSWFAAYLIDRQQSLFPLASPRIVSRLLHAGADPNQQPPSKQPLKRQSDDDELQAPQPVAKDPKTPWVQILESVQQAARRGWIRRYDVDTSGISRWTEILRLFLEHGADPMAYVKATHKDRRETALGLLTRVAEEQHSMDVLKIKQLLEQKSASTS